MMGSWWNRKQRPEPAAQYALRVTGVALVDAKRRCRELEEALRFYADESNYDEDGTVGVWEGDAGYEAFDPPTRTLEPDHGQHARQALGLEEG